MAGRATERDNREKRPPKRRISASDPAPAIAPAAAPMTEAAVLPDPPVLEDAREAIDSDLRYRLISEAAHRLYLERGSVDGYDLEDWLQAESEIDNLLSNTDARGMAGDS